MSLSTSSISNETHVDKRNITSSNEPSTSSTSNEAHVDKRNITSTNELSTSSTSNEAHVEPSLPTRRITRLQPSLLQMNNQHLSSLGILLLLV